MSFITCWFVLLLGVEFQYTPIGIISGLLWVPAGTVGIYGVRNAGIAVCVGTWSGVTVLVSFIWGLFIFGEQVRSRVQTFLAVVLLLFGLSGMAYFSASNVQQSNSKDNKASFQLSSSLTLENDLSQRLLGNDDDDDDVEKELKSKESSIPTASLSTDDNEYDADDEAGLLSTRNSSKESLIDSPAYTEEQRSETIDVCGLKLSRFSVGLAASVYNGALGGSAIVPMHYSKLHGLEFVISFAIGATMITTLLWFLRFLYHLQRRRSVHSAWRALPSFHLRVMCIPGAIAGTLWSIGNVSSIVAVTHLGEGIGMSVVQSAMMVSGLWGIFYFREIQGMKNICWWFVAAFVTLVSIIFLSHEHEAIKSP